MKLLIVESPSKAKTISKYLGSDYKVIASYGHIFEIPSEKGSIDPQNNFHITYKQSSKQIPSIIENAKKADIIYIASDPDREGEGIAWEINESILSKKIKTETKRITYSEITKEAIQHAIKNARNIDTNLVDAQQSRATIDYLVGFNISPVLWKKLSGAKSAGRVQSAALRLIQERELEISKFISKEYWSINVEIQNQLKEKIITEAIEYNGNKFNNEYPSTENETKKIIKSIDSGEIKVINNEKKETQKKPLPPFITSTLQQDALNKFGFNAKKTMQIAQKLYEGIEIQGSPTALITYMRTDGTTISDSALKEIREYILSNFSNEYLPKTSNQYKTKVKNAQEAHEAIRPINVKITPDSLKNKLSDEEHDLYSLIWARTVACQMVNAIQSQESITFEIANKSDKLITKANASKIIFDGYLKVYSDYQKSSNEEIKFDLNSSLVIHEISSKQHFTIPPARYNEGSLIKKLEELGIGRPSTFASILSTLTERKYVELLKKAIQPTKIGMITASFLKNFFSQYVDYSFTAKLEEELDNLSNGQRNKLNLLQEFWTTLTGMINQASSAEYKIILETITNEIEPHIIKTIQKDLKCNKCNTGEMKLNTGKYGYFLSCNNYPDCKNILSYASPDEISQKTDESDESKIFKTESFDAIDKSGKYGRYLEVTFKDAKKQNISIPADLQITAENIEIIVNKKEFTLKDKTKATIGIGKYGPYILWNKKFYQIPKNIEYQIISIQEIEEIINSKKK